MKAALWVPPRLARNSGANAVLEACRIGLERAGHSAQRVEHEKGDFDWVVTWGLGHPHALAAMRKFVESGVSVIGWDAGYWNRTGRDRAFRVSVDAVHPQSIVMRRNRPLRGSRPALRHDYNAAGPIVLIGMGAKSAQTYGEANGDWERTTLAALKRRFPERSIVFRPRPNGPSVAALPGVGNAAGKIEHVLNGASLAVCRHSNVAVDSIIAGVPALADDGAAAAVCPHDLDGRLVPLPEDTRVAFLRNLSWFQWTESEMKQPETWAAIAEMTQDAKDARGC